MALKLMLKPGERASVNGALMISGVNGAELVIESDARVLREADFMKPEEATTPVRKLYLTVLMMYLSPDKADSYLSDFEQRVTQIIHGIVAPEALKICARVTGDVANGEHFKALSRCRILIDFENRQLQPCNYSN